MDCIQTKPHGNSNLECLSAEQDTGRKAHRVSWLWTTSFGSLWQDLVFVNSNGNGNYGLDLLLIANLLHWRHISSWAFDINVVVSNKSTLWRRLRFFLIAAVRRQFKLTRSVVVAPLIFRWRWPSATSVLPPDSGSGFVPAVPTVELVDDRRREEDEAGHFQDPGDAGQVFQVCCYNLYCKNRNGLVNLNCLVCQ